MKKNLFYLLIPLFFFPVRSFSTEDFKVIRQQTGFAETNCYLIHDMLSKDAALIDPGGRIDSLVNYIVENQLNLKYIFITHGHTDHVFYVPEIRKLFPAAKLCINRLDYENMFTQFDWFLKNFGQDFIEKERSNPEHKPFIDFDPKSIGKPDFFVEDNQSFLLGNLEIKTIHSPGHSPGEICYYTQNVIFTGDVLFYRSVGGIHFQGSIKSDLVKSVRALYATFPDATILYPGHGEFSDIGSEKKENEHISETTENLN